MFLITSTYSCTGTTFAIDQFVDKPHFIYIFCSLNYLLLYKMNKHSLILPDGSKELQCLHEVPIGHPVAQSPDVDHLGRHEFMVIFKSILKEQRIKKTPNKFK